MSTKLAVEHTFYTVRSDTDAQAASQPRPSSAPPLGAGGVHGASPEPDRHNPTLEDAQMPSESSQKRKAGKISSCRPGRKEREEFRNRNLDIKRIEQPFRDMNEECRHSFCAKHFPTSKYTYLANYIFDSDWEEMSLRYGETNVETFLLRFQDEPGSWISIGCVMIVDFGQFHTGAGEALILGEMRILENFRKREVFTAIARFLLPAFTQDETGGSYVFKKLWAQNLFCKLFMPLAHFRSTHVAQFDLLAYMRFCLVQPSEVQRLERLVQLPSCYCQRMWFCLANATKEELCKAGKRAKTTSMESSLVDSEQLLVPLIESWPTRGIGKRELMAVDITPKAPSTGWYDEIHFNSGLKIDVRLCLKGKAFEQLYPQRREQLNPAQSLMFRAEASLIALDESKRSTWPTELPLSQLSACTLAPQDEDRSTYTGSMCVQASSETLESKGPWSILKDRDTACRLEVVAYLVLSCGSAGQSSANVISIDKHVQLVEVDAFAMLNYSRGKVIAL